MSGFCGCYGRSCAWAELDLTQALWGKGGVPPLPRKELRLLSASFSNRGLFDALLTQE